MYTLVKNYKENESLRQSFDVLAQETFGLTFADWYENGYWREDYIPYSMVKDGEVAANVSVNIMDMLVNGEIKHLIQLGTVMTRKEHRNQGLIRRLMAEIDQDFAEKADGIYLFAGADVLNFYPQFGFEKAKEYQYSKVLKRTEGGSANQKTMVQIPMDTNEARAVLEKAIDTNVFHGQFDMAFNKGLFLFYVSKFMQETVYYEKELETYVIAEPEGDNLFIHAIFSKKDVSLDQVIQSFGSEIKTVTLGFTPADITGYDCAEIQEEDTTLFVKGEWFKPVQEFDERKVMFPTLSHA